MKVEKKYINTLVYDNFEKVNDEFTKCTISVLSCEQIANGTKFIENAVNDAMSTLNYVPVIGYFNGEEFEGHGQEIVLTDNDIEFKVKTVPFGVVIKDSQRWSEITKANGETEKYLCVDAYLWNRYDKAVKYVSENECNQSMEIAVEDGEYKDTYFEITKFNFEALCILGKDVNPAFKLAKIRTSDKFSKDEFKSEYEEMVSVLDNYLNKDTEPEPRTYTEEEVATIKNDYEKQIEDLKASLVVTETEEYKKVELELADIKAKYTDLQSEKVILNTEVEDLRQFKTNVIKEQKEAEVENMLKNYSELESVGGYQEIIKDKYSIDINELEKNLKVFAFDNGIVLTKGKITKKFSLEENENKKFKKDNSHDNSLPTEWDAILGE